MRACQWCKTEKPLEAFTIRRADSSGRSRVCRDCTNKRKREQYHENADYRRSVRRSRRNPAQIQEQNLRRKYGITEAQYQEMLAEQLGVCAICGGSDPKHFGNRFAVDHDHLCCPGKNTCGKCLRGLLCSACNMGLGQFGESIARLAQAITYLEAWTKQAGYFPPTDH